MFVCSLSANINIIVFFENTLLHFIHFRPLSQLFSVLKSRQSRSLLCDIFQVSDGSMASISYVVFTFSFFSIQELAKKDAELKKAADIVTKVSTIFFSALVQV